MAGGIGPISVAVDGSGLGGSARREVPRLHVLMLGGASRAELRCALEAGGGGHVAFGCTSLASPLEYLAALQHAGGGVAGASGEEDEDEEEEGPASLRGLLSL